VKSINAFVVSAAVEKARTIIVREEHLRLSEDEASQLIFLRKYGFRPLMRHPYILFYGDSGYSQNDGSITGKKP
jgi:hypothetical protein